MSNGTFRLEASKLTNYSNLYAKIISGADPIKKLSL